MYGFLLILLIPIAGLSYLSWHLWCILPMPSSIKWTVIILCWLAVLLLFVSIGSVLDHLPMALASIIYNVSTSSIFVLLYGVMLFLLLDIGRLVRLIPRSWLYSNWISTAAIVIFLTAVFVYGNRNYNRKVRQSISVGTDKNIKKDLRLVLVSDLHLGYHNRADEFRRWVDMINSEQPDAVLIAGDIIDRSVRPLREDSMATIFRQINAPIYASMGNHEFYAGVSEAEKFYADAGITLLRDSTVLTRDNLRIIGRDDRTNVLRKRVKQLVADIGNDEFTILLDHQPYHLEEAERAGIDYQFSGHTHHGQVWPISWITDAIYEDAFGIWQRGHTQYYVSSGLGIWGGKFRIGTRSEYIVLTIKKNSN
ncbi:MAG: metallophosphoesterase [Prevotella sp.]|nr:metallophosphoesterase [Prevotella sp.]